MTGKQYRKRFPLLAPSWIVNQITRAGLPSSTLLNLDKLLDICSLEDIAGMYSLNTEAAFLDRIFGFGAPGSQGLHEYWSRRYTSQLTRVLQVTDLYRSALDERLVGEVKSGAEGSVSFPFMVQVESDDLTINATAIILKPGQFGGAPQREVQQYIVSEYIRQSYAFTDYATLACDQLFGRYLSNVASDGIPAPA